MKIVIDHSATKREIHGAFNLCGSSTDLESIAAQILGALEASKRSLGRDHPFAYGWVAILPNEPQPSKANTPPRGWDS